MKGLMNMKKTKKTLESQMEHLKKNLIEERNKRHEVEEANRELCWSLDSILACLVLKYGGDARELSIGEVDISDALKKYSVCSTKDDVNRQYIIRVKERINGSES